jgi:hypothetical protein
LRHCPIHFDVVQLDMTIRFIAVHASRNGTAGSRQTVLAALCVYTDVICMKKQRKQATQEVVVMPATKIKPLKSSLKGRFTRAAGPFRLGKTCAQ